MNVLGLSAVWVESVYHLVNVLPGVVHQQDRGIERGTGLWAALGLARLWRGELQYNYSMYMFIEHVLIANTHDKSTAQLV
jgi:hypothetical protein